MASLTPGVLSKLIENVNNKTVKIAGEHRSALLQVIGIVPSLAGTDDADPWKNRGFFLRVSDSVHSAYVSVTDEDTALILSDKIQLGQFIHVTRLDSGPSVPVLRGLKPVPKKRPCVGEPKDLISSDSLPNRKRNVREKVSVRDDLRSRRLLLGNVEGVELRRLSLDSSRKAWDRSPRAKNGVPNSKSKSNEASSSPDSMVTVRSAKKNISVKDLSVKYSGLTILPKKNKNLIVSPPKNKNLIVSQLKNNNLTVSPEVITSKPSVDKTETIKLSPNYSNTSLPSKFVKVPLRSKSRSDSKILWDSLPTTVHDVGKEVVSRRNAGLWSTVNALEETYATENILCCMSKFADICESFKKEPTVPLVDWFLNLHQQMQEASSTVNILVNSKSLESKSAKLWVQAAVESNLSNFTLMKKKHNRDHLLGKRYSIILENEPSKKNSSVKGLSYKSKPSVEKKKRVEEKKWSKGSGLEEAANLIEKLTSVSRIWFLNYLEESIKNGFGSRGGKSGGSGGGEVSALLGEIKRVNEWLDESVEKGDERVEGLKKKLYDFLLDQVKS